MSSILASKNGRLVVAWDIRQDPITNTGSSTGPMDPRRMSINQNTWNELLIASPYRVTYVSFSPIIIAKADPRHLASSLRSIAKTQANILDCQILQDIKLVPKELDVHSEKGDNLVFCTFPALKRTNSDVGLCKRLSPQAIDGVMNGRISALAIYTTDDIKKMSKG